MKYYIKRTDENGVVSYKRYQGIEGWAYDKKICWQYSKQGATKAINRMSRYYFYKGDVFELEKAEEVLDAEL